jgi:hypothetical protein
LNEGGYEAADAVLYSSLPGALAPSVEDRIMDKILELAREVGAPGR